MATTHSLQPVPEVDVIVTPAEDDHECVPRRTTRGRASNSIEWKANIETLRHSKLFSLQIHRTVVLAPA